MAKKNLVRITFKCSEHQPLNDVCERIKLHLPEALPKGSRVGKTIRTGGIGERAEFTLMYTLPLDVLLAIISPGLVPGTTLPDSSGDTSGSGSPGD
jgi:hypothetical protein